MTKKTFTSLPLVLAADRSFIPHLATTVISVLETNSDLISRVFLVTNEIREEELIELNRFTQDRYQKVIELLSINSSSVDRFFVSHHVSVSAYLKFFLAEKLPTSESIALYLDSDTVALSPLKELLEHAEFLLNSKDKAGRPHLVACAKEADGEHLVKFGFTSGSYFNSGVMLINLEGWRKEGVASKCAKIAQLLHGKLYWWDQDVLNLALEKRWVELDEKFNFTNKSSTPNPLIAHFAGSTKPWHFGCQHPNRFDYVRFRRLTPFLPFRRSRLGAHLKRTLLPRSFRTGKSIMKLLRKMSRKLRRFVKHPVRSLRGLLLDAAQTVESPNMSALYLQGIKFLIAIFGTSTYLRRLGDYVALSHPIEISKPLPPISLHVVASKKDFPLLPLAVNQARIMSLNPVANVLIIVPERQRGFLPKLPPGVTVVGEEQVLSSEVFETINAHHPPGRRGWIVQQALKLWSVWNSSAEGVLVVDADTILTKKRAFLSSDKKQLLSYSHEYHGPYEEHCSRVWGLRRFDKGLSYVCHHQLMQPEILHEMFPTEDELKNWILAARIEQRSPLADYHSYGRWLVDHHPDRVARGRWGNTKSPLIRDGNSEMLQAKRLLCEVASNVFSVSFHHYLDKSKSFVRD